MTTPTPYRKKLIEVALPLAEINAAAAKEKSIRHGHPSTLHLWWARRPLAACRAVLFASLVDDPSSDPAFADKSEAEQATERERLHQIIRELVPWENANNPEILAKARAEIMRSTNGNPPPVLDPFCGGGSIPLEAQQLGLEAHASDLNPVAVLITKALIEIPPKFAGQKPVNPDSRRLMRTWSGAEGLAADVRHYGAWMRTEAEKRIGYLYPKSTLPKEMGGGEATVIAWLWARTVTCPNPACGAEMPMASSFVLSKKAGKQAWVEPFIEPGERRVRFEVRSGNGQPPDPPKLGRGAQFRCLHCGNVVREDHIRAEGVAGRMGAQLMAIVAEGARNRVYLAPNEEHERIAGTAKPEWRPDQDMPKNPRWFSPPMYGLTSYGDLFTDRQLVALTTFSDLVREARERALADARAASLPDDGLSLSEGGNSATAYADALATYLAFGVSRMSDICNALCRWESSKTQVRNLFGRQAIPMIWDFAEPNIFAEAAGDFAVSLDNLAKVIDRWVGNKQASVSQVSANQAQPEHVLVSTDPPYYDNIGYADLSDFFYVWLRRSLRSFHPELFRTLLVPKNEELIASPYRHDNDRHRAQHFFEQGLLEVFAHLHSIQMAEYPLTLFYAFKQRESDADAEAEELFPSELNGLASTGWETMLEGLVNSGFSIVATWPMRTESSTRPIGQGTNALASSIVLACRPRPASALTATRREFMAALRRELDRELAVLLETNIAPVDLAQATIGPGLAIFTRYAKVIEADGSEMRIRTALALINEILDQVLEARDERLDADTRFCVAWYAQFQYVGGPFGQADVLARAKGVAVDGLHRAGVVEAKAGKVRILRRDELARDWDPDDDERVPVWEALQHLIARLEGAGVEGAGALLAKLGEERGEQSKQLAVRLYELCDRKRWSADAYSYNQLVREYPDIQKTIAEEAARYDGFVREYPQIQETAKRLREEQMTMF